jgi:hypothetical protein
LPGFKAHVIPDGSLESIGVARSNLEIALGDNVIGRQNIAGGLSRGVAAGQISHYRFSTSKRIAECGEVYRSNIEPTSKANRVAFVKSSPLAGLKVLS